MKKKIIIAITIVLVMLVMVTGVFYWEQLRGIWPAILKPQQNIVPLLETASTTGSSPLHIPSGFSLSIFAKELDDPRVMIFDPVGTVLVSIPSRGEVLALSDANHDGIADQPVIVAQGLNRPHGLALQCGKPDCTLFIAEESRVAAYSYDTYSKKATLKKVLTTLPTGGNHTTRSLLLYEGKLLVSAGSSCNVCRESGQDRANIRQIDLSSDEVKTFATGLRNAVFMAVNPHSGAIWATEMGRDLLGDDIPPDELNIIKEGANYGWPICYGKNIHDTAFDTNIYIRNPCMEPFETPSYIDIPAHSAPLGLAFIPASWPARYKNDLLVAYHGSWNRSIPTGYKIVRYRFDDKGTYQGVEDFMTGWLTKDGSALGRPVGIIISDDGTTYISDDKAGVIYRLEPPKQQR